MSDSAGEAARLITNARRVRDPLVVAIDGLGGAGKSTLADALRARLNDASIVLGDDFYRPMDAGARAGLGPREGYERYFDWQRLAEEVLDPLSRGRAAVYRRYDWSRDRLGDDPVEVQPRGVILVEGVYSARPELRGYVDLAIYVETPRAERERRLRARGQDEAGWIARWMAAEEWYEREHRPRERADLVVRGDDAEPEGPPTLVDTAQGGA